MACVEKGGEFPVEEPSVVDKAEAWERVGVVNLVDRSEWAWSWGDGGFGVVGPFVYILEGDTA